MHWPKIHLFFRVCLPPPYSRRLFFWVMCLQCPFHNGLFSQLVVVEGTAIFVSREIWAERIWTLLQGECFPDCCVWTWQKHLLFLRRVLQYERLWLQCFVIGVFWFYSFIGILFTWMFDLFLGNYNFFLVITHISSKSFFFRSSFTYWCFKDNIHGPQKNTWFQPINVCLLLMKLWEKLFQNELSRTADVRCLVFTVW